MGSSSSKSGAGGKKGKPAGKEKVSETSTYMHREPNQHQKNQSNDLMQHRMSNPFNVLSAFFLSLSSFISLSHAVR